MSSIRLRSMWSAARPSLIAVALTLALGFVVVLLVSDRPFAAYEELLLGNFSSPQRIGNLLTRTVPILLIALGIVFAFRGGVFNVGGEGQLYLGAVSAAATGLALPDLPGVLLVPACLAAGVLAGAVWGWVPGFLKARMQIDEVVTTLMLNFIALLITGYLVSGPMRDRAAYGATSRMLPDSAFLGPLPGPFNINTGVLIAAALVPVAWFLLFRTVWGSDLRAAGANPRFAEAVGVNATRNIIMSMVLSGAMAGLAGAIYVLGTGHRFEQNFSPGLGLIGLTVALLARIHPVGVVFAAVFYAMMINGAALMQLETNVPRSLVSLLTGILVLIMTVEFRRRASRRKEAVR
jgi:simple sugar transport system permease protein